MSDKINELAELLKKYGKVEQCEIKNDMLHVKITQGFAGKANETFDLIEVVGIATENKFPLIKMVNSDKDLFHIILKK